MAQIGGEIGDSEPGNHRFWGSMLNLGSVGVAKTLSP